jgi:hypothetical protein
MNSLGAPADTSVAICWYLTEQIAYWRALRSVVDMVVLHIVVVRPMYATADNYEQRTARTGGASQDLGLLQGVHEKRERG